LRILRFQRSERLVHWAIAIPFMVCYATAVVLVVFYNQTPDRPYRDLFSWVHRLSGLCLFVCPALVLLRNRQDLRFHLDNIRQAWSWTLSDVKWLCLMGLATVSSRFTLPEQGKFNAAEKLNFMMVMGTWPLYIVTGVLIWLPGVAFVAWALHIAMAVAATPLMLGHIFMATINPGTRAGLSGMFSGFVDRQWAKHHYRRWYREQFEAPGSSPPPAVVIGCPACGREQAAASWDSLLQSVLSSESISCSHCRRTIDVVSVAGPSCDLERILEQLGAGGAAPEATAGESLTTLKPRVACGERGRSSAP